MTADSRFRFAHDLPPLDAEPAVREAARALVEAVRQAAGRRALSAESYAAALETLGRVRGQPLALPLLASGDGSGARVRLADGRPVLDLVSGIGPYVFGHGDPDLLETAVVAAASDVVFQGHVLPGPEYARLAESLARHAGPRLETVWLSLSGSMANENAWKTILQKRAPADEVLAFEHAFHGRTLAMAALTDRPEYREGLPVRETVHRVPFHDPTDPHSTQKSVDSVERALAARPGRIAAMCFELVQGEGGFNDAPPAFFRALMERCRRAGVAVWVDEIQTFARTGELFAFRTLGLEDLVDVVTVGKILQGSAMLVSDDYRPRPKLVAGTWAGASVGMAVGARILERLEQGGYLGPEGRVAHLAGAIDRAFEALAARCPGAIGGRSGLGAMQAFVAWDGDPAHTNELIACCLEEGVLFQTAGSRPMKVRLLPPLDLTEEELDSAFAALERAIRRVASRYGLPPHD
ncbi:MAG: aminotransferase class III-fold pyridoxal phosphate-dependent enzyme [Myxococcales bacterium]|nr:aminotransferase class III-fold pyridoxal phosphate-dependent enzyme [Myxococcales bacterium]